MTRITKTFDFDKEHVSILERYDPPRKYFDKVNRINRVFIYHQATVINHLEERIRRLESLLTNTQGETS